MSYDAWIDCDPGREFTEEEVEFWLDRMQQRGLTRKEAEWEFFSILEKAAEVRPA